MSTTFNTTFENTSYMNETITYSISLPTCNYVDVGDVLRRQVDASRVLFKSLSQLRLPARGAAQAVDADDIRAAPLHLLHALDDYQRHVLPAALARYHRVQVYAKHALAARAPQAL